MPPHERKPHPPHPPGHGPRERLPASRVVGFIDRAALETQLLPWLPDAGERAFVLRCIVDEGPLHHRGANYILLALLARAAAAHGARLAPTEGEPVPMRLPPHLADSVAEGVYPVQLPLEALRELAGGDEHTLGAMVDCLTDGPPQHALANVAMVALLEALLRGRA